MPHILTLNEIGNNIDKHFQIRGYRENNDKFIFTIFNSDNINEILGHNNLANNFNSYKHRHIHLFKLFLLRAIKSYNLYHNWDKEKIIEHKKNIIINLKMYREKFTIPYNNWINNKLNIYEDLFNFMRKLNSFFYLEISQNDIIHYELSSKPDINLFELAFSFPKININELNENQINQAKLNYFNNCLGNLINDNILPIQIFNHEAIPQVRINNNLINNLRNIFDIEVPYTVDDFMNKIYIPNPDKMPPRIKRDDFDDLMD